MSFENLPLSFREKIEVEESGCWRWTGGTNPNGYACYWSPNQRLELPWRYAYGVLIGECPDRIHPDCETRNCANPRHYTTTEERFWRRFHRAESGCLEWTGPLNPKGYGYCGIKSGERLAHRQAWVYLNGEIPPGICVLHRCDNPLCGERTHLWLGTNQENVDDKMRKGRHRVLIGAENPISKLDEESVLAIRNRDESAADLAREYGVTATLVCNIRKGKIWRHVGGRIGYVAPKKRREK